MNLFALAEMRASQRPIGVGLIGAGKFASMFLAQVPTMPGIAVRAVADLDPGLRPNSRSSLKKGEIQELIHKVWYLAEDSDIEVINHFDTLSSCLRSNEVQHLVAESKKHLDNFDFERVKKPLQLIADKFNVTIESRLK